MITSLLQVELVKAPGGGIGKCKGPEVEKRSCVLGTGGGCCSWSLLGTRRVAPSWSRAVLLLWGTREVFKEGKDIRWILGSERSAWPATASALPISLPK